MPDPTQQSIDPALMPHRSGEEPANDPPPKTGTRKVEMPKPPAPETEDPQAD